MTSPNPMHNLQLTDDEVALVRQHTMEIYKSARLDNIALRTDKKRAPSPPVPLIENPKVNEFYGALVYTVFKQLLRHYRWPNLGLVAGTGGVDGRVNVTSGYKNKPVPGVELFESELMALDLNACKDREFLYAYHPVLEDDEARSALLKPFAAASWVGKVGPASERKAQGRIPD